MGSSWTRRIANRTAEMSVQGYHTHCVHGHQIHGDRQGVSKDQEHPSAPKGRGRPSFDISSS